MRKSKKVKIDGKWYQVVSVWSMARATATTRRALYLYDIRRFSEWLVDDSKGQRWFATVDPGQSLSLQWETNKESPQTEIGRFNFDG